MGANFWLISDIHADIWAQEEAPSLPEHEDSDGTLVLAGDLCEVWNIHTFLPMLCKRYKNVIYVPGNHDRYDYVKSGLELIEEIIRLKIPNLIFLNNGVTELDGVRIAGTTMWFPMTETARANAYYLNDFRYIPGFAHNVDFWNQEAVRFLKSLKDNSADLIITHHLPSKKSIAGKYARSNLNCYYLCDMEEYIPSICNSVWVHGHTHIPTDYQVEHVRVLSNPRGYPGENNNVKPIKFYV